MHTASRGNLAFSLSPELIDKNLVPQFIKLLEISIFSIGSFILSPSFFLPASHIFANEGRKTRES
jgi:hypothetical protein